MKEEEIVIRYRMPPIPVNVTQEEKKMMEEAHRNFGGQVIKQVMNYLDDNGVELVAVKKRDHMELMIEDSRRIRNAGEVSVPDFLRMR